MPDLSRAERFAQYILDNNSTIRKTAKYFNISKSTVHNDVSKKLRIYNYPLYKKVKKILIINFNEKHIRGGNSTKLKYEKTIKGD
jgi:putative DeoR family transcriptional regulator (stage III sporulation protein D)